jgi:hypothetical protein
MTVTVSGGGSTVLVFNVSGSAATNYANDFSGAVGANPIVSILSNGTPESTVAGALNIIYDTTGSSGTFPTYSLTTADQYTFVSAGSPVTVDGSTAGDTLFGGAALTYIESATGHDNRVVFTDGNNIFEGSSTGGAGDTIVGGSGYDTIVTGSGPSTVFSGTGHSLITLNDTVAGDKAVMQNGNTTIIADGVSDTVNASATGVIFGGAGTLTFVASASASTLPVTVVGGTGTSFLFGANNTDLTLSGGGTNYFIAGTGNETLNGGESGGFSFFGNTTATDASYSVSGGAGIDYFSTGAGSETITAGFGSDSFNIASVAGGGANITINDFTSSDSVSFEASITSQGENSDNTGYTVTLSDGTHVEFVGLTSLPTHIT